AFRKSSGLALAASGLGGVPTFLARAAQATPVRGPHARRKTLVCVFQRGAMDGLAAVQPLNDPFLQRLRPRLAVDRRGDDALIDLGNDFGMHPALAPLASLYREGLLGVVHGVGSPIVTRSHFDAQDFMETGLRDERRTRSGWLNRASGMLGHEAPVTPFRAVAITPALPVALQGDAPALAIAKLDDFGVVSPGMTGLDAAGQGLEALYAQTARDVLGDASRQGFEAVRLLEDARLNKLQPSSVEYPRTPLARSLSQIAQLVKAEVGLEIAFAESGGWETHAQQGSTSGGFARRGRDLAGSLAAFWEDLGPYQDDVVLMTMTEFGRTVAQNGSGGTDHGRGSCLFVIGHDVKGAEVHGSIPTLDPDALEDGRDLPVTTDFRRVFAGLAGDHLGIENPHALFPDWDGPTFSLLR
ncbi:MAG TPA: DUF1501 domain-containing protein, partial [Bacteroidetes bacterium]|nr:DUF1501 domain-containing protein [Bacteroidota bacterium]